MSGIIGSVHARRRSDCSRSAPLQPWPVPTRARHGPPARGRRDAPGTGADALQTTVSPTRTTLAAKGSPGSTATQSRPPKRAPSIQSGLSTSRSSPAAVTADFRWRHRSTANALDRIAQRLEDRLELAQAVVVRPARYADEDPPAGQEHIAAVHCTGRGDGLDRTISAERRRDGVHFPSPRGAPGRIVRRSRRTRPRRPR